MRRTPLHQQHRGLGASLTEFAGWSMPVRYSSETAEHHAVRRAAGLFDLSHMGEVEVEGPDAARALDRALVGRPSAIAPGRARYSMVCDEDGGIIDDLVVYRRADDRYLVVANAANTAAVVAALSERAASVEGGDVLVRDASSSWALVAVQGPVSAAVLGALTDLVVGELRYYSIAEGTLAGHDVLVARTGYTGEDGFEVYCAPGDAPAVWQALLAAGQPRGLVPAGLACRDTLRLEAGMPLYGHELSRTRTPFAAGLGRVVDFGKPDGFVGQDALLAARDAPPTECLVGIVGAGRRAPRQDHVVLDPDGERAVGRVTSGAPSPTLGRPVAMAYVRADLATAGTRLLVDVRGQTEAVEVVALPFYQRTH